MKRSRSGDGLRDGKSARVRPFGRARGRGGAWHGAEGLEPRVMLASAVAAFAPQVTYAVGGQPRGVAAVDASRDNRLDLAVANGASNSLSLYSGNAGGTFGISHTLAVGSGPFGVVG